MLKRIFFLLVCTNLCAAESLERNKLLDATIIFVTTGLGAALYVATMKAEIPLPSNFGDIDGSLKIAQAGVVIAGAGVATYGLRALYPLAKEVYKSTFSTKEQKALYDATVQEHLKRYELLNAKRQFRNCLLECHSDSKKNGSGLPASCEETARMLSALGAQIEVDRMTKIFNHFRE